MGAINAKDVSWSVKKVKLLREVNLDAHTGEVVGLLGPNGSGKTSFLRLLAGLRKVDSGNISYDNHNIANLSRREIARRIAILEQDVTANGELSVRQVVELGRTPFRGRFDSLSSEDEQIIDNSLERVNISDKQHRMWHTLSGGEKQRVQLARALAQQPQEILLDEPTNHLDIRHQIELLELLQTLKVTCVIALHDLNLAARYCDHLVMLDKGRVVAAGKPVTVLTRKIIRNIYQVDAIIDTEPVTHTLRVTYLSGIL